MHKTVSGTYSNGNIELRDPLELPNGAGVEIEIHTVSGGVSTANSVSKNRHECRSVFLEKVRAFTNKYPEVFKDLKFTREELHERR